MNDIDSSIPVPPEFDRTIIDALRPIYAELRRIGMGDMEACGVIGMKIGPALRTIREEQDANRP